MHSLSCQHIFRRSLHPEPRLKWSECTETLLWTSSSYGHNENLHHIILKLHSLHYLHVACVAIAFAENRN